LSAFLHFGSVHAEIVGMNAMSRLKMQPLPTRMNPTRTSLRARARRVNFSHVTGMRSKEVLVPFNVPLGLETRHAHKVSHCREVEEYL